MYFKWVMKKNKIKILTNTTINIKRFAKML